MSDIQIDWIGAAAFIVPPVAFLFLQEPLSNKDSAFYDHFTHHSALFPRGRWRLIFPLAWWILYTMQGIGAYVFWHDADTSTGSHLTMFNVGLVFYWVQLLVSFAWMKLFFNRRNPRWVSFVAIVLIDAGVIGMLVCASQLEVPYSIAAFAVLLAWLVYASILTVWATFVIPGYKDRVDPLETDTTSSEAPAIYAQPAQSAISATPTNARVGQPLDTQAALIMLRQNQGTQAKKFSTKDLSKLQLP